MSDRLEQGLRDLAQKMHDQIIEDRLFPEYLNVSYVPDSQFYISYHVEGEYIKQGRNSFYYAKPDRVQSITPKKIREVIPAAWEEFILLGGVHFDYHHTTRKVSQMEHQMVHNTLTKNIPEMSVETFNWRDINPGIKRLTENGAHADTLLANPRDFAFRKTIEGYTPSHNQNQKNVQTLGKSYMGQLGFINVHRSTFVPKNTAIIYEKKHARCKMTYLDVIFDSYTRPRNLIIKESLYAWFRKEGAGLKLQIS